MRQLVNIFYLMAAFEESMVDRLWSIAYKKQNLTIILF